MQQIRGIDEHVSPKAAIFDMDGTLVDSVDLHAKAWQDALRHFGKEIPFDDVRSQIGKGGDQIVPFFFRAEEANRISENLRNYEKQIFRDRYMKRTRAFPGVRQLFERIRAAGLKTALATSSPELELSYNKRLANIEDLLDAQSTGDDTERSKPHPDIFHAVLNQLDGISAEEAIAVGDSPYDAQAATHAGMRAVGFRCGGFPEDSLRDAGCIAIFDGPEDLLRRFETSPVRAS